MAERGQVPRLLRTVFAAEDLFRCGLVVEKNARGDEILSETAGLDPNYIRQLLLPGLPRLGAEPEPRTLLHLLLRHAARLEHATAGLQLLAQRGVIGELELYERELVNITEDAPTLRELLERPVVGLTGRLTLAEFLDQPRPNAPTPEERRVDEYRRALGDLEPLPTAELERLFTETLDVCAYRLDAWATSLATQQLAALREEHPEGTYIGAYGWVDELRPFPADERQEVDLPDEPGARAYTYNGGYVQAPSMAHAATAAVLRNAYMTRSGDAQSPYAVNLSSARVRKAMSVLDAVRAGQPLGAILGYLFERGLHDAQLDRFIDDFRGKYRLASSGADSGAAAAEAIAARDTVDGYALVRDYRSNTHWDRMPPPGQAFMGQVDAVLATVDEALDALADLLTAESVHQLVSGNMDGAGATLDAMAKGAHPPEPAVVSQPRGGTSLTHRVILTLSAAQGSGDAWPPAAGTPRGEAEPRLNAWVGRILGDPSGVICRVDLGAHPPVWVTLRSLELQPLDVLALARSEESGVPADSELYRRIVQAAVGESDATASEVLPSDLDCDPPGLTPDQLSFAEALELARSINRVLGQARPLAPRDLLLPEEAGAVESEGGDARPAELAARVQAIQGLLADAIELLDTALASATPQALREALRAAAGFGVVGAYPPAGVADLTALAQSVRDELCGRLERAARPGAESDPLGPMRAMLGQDFTILPAFTPARRGELSQALVTSPDAGDDPEAAVTGWLAQAARVRRPLDAWRRLSLYTVALGRASSAPRIVQLPHAANSRWIGLPLAGPGLPRPNAGRLSLFLLGEAPWAADAAEGWAGLLLDEWPEVIPNAAEDVAVAFHYDRPNAEAPQAVLVAVPPRPGEPWSLDLLSAIVEETFGMAKTRGFDGEWTRFGGERGHALYDNPWLPMIFLADGDPDATVTTDFGPCRGAQP